MGGHGRPWLGQKLDTARQRLASLIASHGGPCSAMCVCVSMARWRQPPERGALNENETRKGAKWEPDKWAQEDEPPDARMQVPL